MTLTGQAIPAAQYLRMSTDHQQYSFDNQIAAILAYAAKEGFVITHTYSDAGKSGLVLKRRDGLRQLLNDVVGGVANYKAILVYDVSRWGRFQDADEAAHYEFLCKTAGIYVHYCAELFANDNSLSSTIMKALKRVMAGEYSRELSVKVNAGSKRVSQNSRQVPAVIADKSESLGAPRGSGAISRRSGGLSKRRWWKARPLREWRGRMASTRTRYLAGVGSTWEEDLGSASRHSRKSFHAEWIWSAHLHNFSAHRLAGRRLGW